MKRQSQAGFLLAKIRQASARVFAGILRDHGIRLNPSQGRVLFPLWREGAMPISEIATRAALGKSTLTAMLDRLERDGHVRRVRSAEDRRVILIEPAALDEASQAAYVKASQEMSTRFYAGFSKAEITAFENCLERILGNLTHPAGRQRSRSYRLHRDR